MSAFRSFGDSSGPIGRWKAFTSLDNVERDHNDNQHHAHLPLALRDVGEGALTFDLAAGTVSGWTEPFWFKVRSQLVQTSFARGATTFAAAFGTGGVLEGRFFGPQGVNVALRAKGGGPGFAAVSGIMTGVCEG